MCRGDQQDNKSKDFGLMDNIPINLYGGDNGDDGKDGGDSQKKDGDGDDGIVANENDSQAKPQRLPAIITSYP